MVRDMKILLVKPPLNPNMVTTTRIEPLELEYLAAAVHEHEVDILDMRVDRNLSKKLKNFKPHLVGTTAYTCDVNTSKRILREVKTHDSSIHTVIGGIHATFVPDDFAEPYIDTVFLGYADFTFKAYVDTLEQGGDPGNISDLGFVNGNKITFTESKRDVGDLDQLPMPARHLIRKYQNKYRDGWGDKKVASVMSSRGCPFRCTFCACWKLMNGKLRTRKVESIIEEIQSLPEEVDVIYFCDDNTLFDIKRAWHLSEMIQKLPVKKKIKLYARADTVVKHPDLFESLREAGLEYLTVGFESSKDEELEKLNKKVSAATNNEAIRILKKLGIFVLPSFIVDPDYLEEDFEQLYNYVDEKCLFRPIFPVLTPSPGTDLYEETHDRLVIRDYDYYDYTHSVLPTKMSRRDFYHQVADLYRKSYSIRRFIRFKINGSRSFPADSEDFYAYNADGFSFFTLLLANLVALPMFMKLRNTHRSEPLV